jgi:hypothetical protein
VSSVSLTSADTNALYNLTVGEKAYFIYEQVSLMACRLMEIRRSCWLVSINASENGGELGIDLPRNLIDSKTPSDTDKPFLVYEDDIDKTISFVESTTTEKTRGLIIAK